MSICKHFTYSPPPSSLVVSTVSSICPSLMTSNCTCLSLALFCPSSLLPFELTDMFVLFSNVPPSASYYFQNFCHFFGSFLSLLAGFIILCSASPLSIYFWTPSTFTMTFPSPFNQICPFAVCPSHLPCQLHYLSWQERDELNCLLLMCPIIV